MMTEGAGRVYKVFAQCGELRSESMQHPVTFNLSTTRLNDGASLPPCTDLTEIFPNHSAVAFAAVKTRHGRWEARELCVLADPSPEETPRIEVDYGVISRLNNNNNTFSGGGAGGTIQWLKYGPLRFPKESLVLKSARDAQLPLTDLLQVGRTVRFKADVSGPKSRWQAISVAPLSDVRTGRGRVSRVAADGGFGWITSPDYGEVYFPFKCFVQPVDPEKRLPSPELLVNAEVAVQVCASLPGSRGDYRAVRVALIDE